MVSQFNEKLAMERIFNKIPMPDSFQRVFSNLVRFSNLAYIM